MLDRLREDVRTAVARDPAARSRVEVVLTYPGLHAVWCHRIAHWLWGRGHPLAARVLAHVARVLTGVEIHPAAAIGDRLFVDHGMGTVIGETAEVGDDVHMHHGVTLGGDSPDPEKRHPTIGDGVTIGADATLVGPVTVGDGATVGAGAVVVDDVPPGVTVVGVPAKPVGGAGSGDETVERSGDATGRPGDAGDAADGDGRRSIGPAGGSRGDTGPEGANAGGTDAGDTDDADADGAGTGADGGGEGTPGDRSGGSRSVEFPCDCAGRGD